MPKPSPAPLAGPAAAPSPTPVTLAYLTARQVANLLVAPPPRLLINCDGQLLPHPLGVCRFVAQLLVLHSRGTAIWLCNVHPRLRGCLQHLKLGAAFHLPG